MTSRLKCEHSFCEYDYPSKLSSKIGNYLSGMNITLDEPLSALSSLFCFFVYLIYISTYQFKNISFLYLIFASMANQLGSFMMHATFNHEMSCSDSYTMHTGFVLRLLLLILGLNSVSKYVMVLLLSIVTNSVFIDSDASLFSIISSLLGLELYTNPAYYLEIRIISALTICALSLQLLSRKTDNKMIQDFNKYVEPHSLWHLISMILIVYYSYKFDNITIGKESLKDLYYDKLFYGTLSVTSTLYSVGQYITKSVQLLIC